MKKIDKRIRKYIREKFNGIGNIETEYVCLENKYNVKINIIFNHIKPLEIEVRNNYYTDEDFNFDYIILTIFTTIRNHILDSYIKGSRCYYDE